MITLKDFVKETLNQITDAVIEFADEKGETGANANPRINPVPEGTGLIAGVYDHDKRRHDVIMPVEFDVAVSAEETEAKEAGGGVRVMSFIRADGSIAKETVASSVSRVSFRIPLRLPDTGAHGEPREDSAFAYGQTQAITDDEGY